MNNTLNAEINLLITCSSQMQLQWSESCNRMDNILNAKFKHNFTVICSSKMQIKINLILFRMKQIQTMTKQMYRNKITFNTMKRKSIHIMSVFKQQGLYKNQITYNSWTAHRTYILYIISAKKSNWGSYNH